MNFLFTLDKNYIEPLKMCLLSIMRFPSKDGWNVYIITKNTEDFNDFAGLPSGRAARRGRAGPFRPGRRRSEMNQKPFWRGLLRTVLTLALSLFLLSLLCIGISAEKYGQGALS